MRTADNINSLEGVRAQRTHSTVVLAVSSDTPGGTFASISEGLCKNGFKVVPDIAEDGSHLLRISGFKRHDEVLKTLAEQGLAVQEVAPDAPEEKKKLLGRLKDRSLGVSGTIYLIGDVSLFLSGVLSGRPKEAAAGLLYSSGGLVSAIYGSPSDARQIRNVGVRMGDYLTQHGAQIPGSSSLSSVMTKRRGGLLEKIETFLYRHPSEVHNAIYAIGGVQLMRSGLQKRKAPTIEKRAGWGDDVAAGALVTTGGAIGALVPEKHDKKKHGGVVEWIQEKPLRLAGYLYTLNNVFLIKSAWKEAKAPSSSSYAFKFITAGCFLAANAFMSMTSRNHAATGPAAQDKRHIIEGMAAEVIAAQPEDMRAALTRQVAGFLSMQPETRQDAALLEQAIARKVTALETSPWQKKNARIVAIDAQPQQAQGVTKLWADRAATAAVTPTQRA